MYNIKTLNKISNVGMKKFDKSKYHCGDDVANPDAIMVRSASMHDMEMPKSLLAIARAGAGTNNIPVADCAEKGIVVFNTPGANANAVKELVILGLLISSRKIVDGYNWTQSLKGQEGIAAAVEKGKSQFVGPEIAGKTLGVIGLGAIGVLVANAAIALGMKVYGYDPFLSVNAAWNLNSHVVKAANMDEIFAVSDYITVHVPLTPDTKETFNAENLAKCKDGVRIKNFSRGELANNADIKAAIESGKVSRYVVDFPNEETVGVDGIITLPPLGASTPEAEDNCAAMAARELMDYLENGNITNSVNYPNCSAPRIAGHDRICILHKNVPAILSGATSLFSSKGLNINNMTNNAKGEYAYTIMDAEPIGEDITAAIKAIDGVIAVRIIK